MAKNRVQFLCNHCGSVHAKWVGKCPDCGTWNSLEEYKAPSFDARSETLAAQAVAAGQSADLTQGSQAVTLGQIDQADTPRMPSGIGEFDRILGGGIVPGSAVLIGGDPGIGKSTLLLEVAHALTSNGAAKRGANTAAASERRRAARLAKGAPDADPSASLVSDPSPSEVAAAGDRLRGLPPVATKLLSVAPSPPLLPSSPSSPPTVLYVSSEESARQTGLRASRLGVSDSSLLVLAETNVERIIHQILKHQPAVVIIDSIQMIYKPTLPAAPGSVTQLRQCCMDLVYLAKSSGIAVLFVGHVTKAGTLAGPKIIEHIVDTVVYFEGDRFHSHRVVRCIKNRFGSTHEVGLFEMTGQGLREVTDPGNLFVEQYGPQGPPSGSIITAAMQGSRVLLVEVQALTASSVIGAAKRKVSGVSSDRVAMIIAVLEKRAELRLAAEDVFVNVAGGVKVAEPAIDLAIAMAIASAHMNRPLSSGTLAIGELGLGGEIRTVPQLEHRLREASRLGLGHAIVPHMGDAAPKLGGMALHSVRRLSQALAGL